MRINGIIWLREIVQKLAAKHRVYTWEVEEVMSTARRLHFVEKGHVAGEHVYAAAGQTASGRYLMVYFVHKSSGEALVISGRDMTRKERRAYGKK